MRLALDMKSMQPGTRIDKLDVRVFVFDIKGINVSDCDVADVRLLFVMNCCQDIGRSLKIP